ncbi:hypothetical protein TNCT_600451 [Trichonephila clavata]|uniref:Uncharacterized protein n=1 Tax=Trichonephila clavata TaxID=2740835 RepID=A0A8X6IKR7_TRICU|nr:hypothetical protein TNCT_600451 [Trichonephila clavata]
MNQAVLPQNQMNQAILPQNQRNQAVLPRNQMNQVVPPQNQMNQAALNQIQINLTVFCLIELVHISKEIFFEHLNSSSKINSKQVTPCSLKIKSLQQAMIDVSLYTYFNKHVSKIACMQIVINTFT